MTHTTEACIDKSLSENKREKNGKMLTDTIFFYDTLPSFKIRLTTDIVQGQ